MEDQNSVMEITYLYSISLEEEMNEFVKTVRTIQTCTKKYVSPVKLRKIYRILCHWQQLPTNELRKTVVGVNKLLTAFERSVIHYLLERFYWIRYGDSDIVADLLQKLFCIDGHLGKIFDFQQLSIILRKRKANGKELGQTTWTNDEMYDQEIQPVQYFLEHSNKRRIVFNGKRLAEHHFVQCIYYRGGRNVPLILPPCSRMFCAPEVLIHFLHYGLFADSDANEDIEKLLTGIIGVIVHSREDNMPSNYTFSVIETGNVLLRAVSRIDLPSLLKQQKLGNKSAIKSHLVQQLSDHRYLPYLNLRCTGPQELQHLCRRRIRCSLYYNWQLPQGISLLPIPRPLKDYINLKYG